MGIIEVAVIRWVTLEMLGSPMKEGCMAGM